jgi:hypothetical protein
MPTKKRKTKPVIDQTCRDLLAEFERRFEQCSIGPERLSDDLERLEERINRLDGTNERLAQLECRLNSGDVHDAVVRFEGLDRRLKKLEQGDHGALKTPINVGKNLCEEAALKCGLCPHAVAHERRESCDQPCDILNAKTDCAPLTPADFGSAAVKRDDLEKENVDLTHDLDEAKQQLANIAEMLNKDLCESVFDAVMRLDCELGMTQKSYTMTVKLLDAERKARARDSEELVDVKRAYDYVATKLRVFVDAVEAYRSNDCKCSDCVRLRKNALADAVAEAKKGG